MRGRLLAVALGLLLSACGGDGSGTTPTEPSPTTQEPAGTSTAPATSEETEPPTGELAITSEAFGEGDTIPGEFSCEGQNQSPPLAWSGVPDGTVELALTMLDPDAGDFPHWGVWAIDPATPGLGSGSVAAGARQWAGGYFGPCPPPGDPHRYVFTLYALSAPLDVPDQADAQELLDALASADALATATLTGLFASGQG